MGTTLEGLEAALKDLIVKRDDLKIDLGEVSAAITGVEAAIRVFTKKGTNSTTKAASSRSGERAVPDALRTAVIQYTGTIGRKFTSRELRDWLEADPQNFSEKQTGDVLGTLMKRLVSEHKIKVVTPPMGRRLGVYELSR